MGPLNIHNNEQLLSTYITDIIQGIGIMTCPHGAYNLPRKTVQIYVLVVTMKEILLSNLIGCVIFQYNNNGVKLEASNRKISRSSSQT